jgi:hypothetical protein
VDFDLQMPEAGTRNYGSGANPGLANDAGASHMSYRGQGWRIRRYLANLRILDYVQPEIRLLSAQALGLLRAVDSAYR